MNKVKNPCMRCSKVDVCKYRDEVFRVVQSLEQATYNAQHTAPSTQFVSYIKDIAYLQMVLQGTHSSERRGEDE